MGLVAITALCSAPRASDDEGSLVNLDELRAVLGKPFTPFVIELWAVLLFALGFAGWAMYTLDATGWEDDEDDDYEAQSSSDEDSDDSSLEDSEAGDDRGDETDSHDEREGSAKEPITFESDDEAAAARDEPASPSSEPAAKKLRAGSQ